MKKTLAFFTIFVLLALLMGPLVWTANAGAETGSQKETRSGDDKYRPPPPLDKKEDHRTMWYKVSEDTVTVISTGKMEDKDNIFFFSLHLKGAPTLHLNYFRKSDWEEMERRHKEFNENRSFRKDGQKHPPQQGSPQPKQGPEELGLSLKLLGLREFNGTEEKVSNYDFTKQEFRKPKVTEMKDGDQLSSLAIQTGTTDGIFSLKIQLFSSLSSEAGWVVGPSEIKYDIIIKDYPFKENDSYLALDTALSIPEGPVTPFNRELEGERPEQGEPPVFMERGVGFEKSSASMFFSWATNVTVDGEEHNVTAEYSGWLDDEGRTVDMVSFIYPAGEKIYHDPKLGVADLLEDSGDTALEFVEMLLSWSTGLGVGLVVVAVVGFRHRPGKFDWEE